MKIKFRVWDKKNKEMHQLITWHDPRYLDSVEYSTGQSSGDVQTLKQDENCIITQYTGINDKNNKEIYEGDIVKTIFGTGQVTYQTGCFWISEIRLRLGQCRHYYKIEILGNIYEDKELRKEDVRR